MQPIIYVEYGYNTQVLNNPPIQLNSMTVQLNSMTVHLVDFSTGQVPLIFTNTQ